MSWLGDVRDVVVLEGPDAATYLQSQASQDLRGMAVGDAQWTFFLQPTGKVDVLARVTMGFQASTAQLPKRQQLMSSRHWIARWPFSTRKVRRTPSGPTFEPWPGPWSSMNATSEPAPK